MMDYHQYKEEFYTQKNMKKTLLTLSSIALAASPVAVAISCGSKGPQFTITSKDENPELKAGASKIANKSLAAVVSDPENPRWKKARESLQTNGTSAGFETKTEIKKSVTDQQSWLGNQKNANAWIVGATDSALAGAWLDRKQSQPVIAYDRLVKTSNRDAYNWYVTYDNSLVGWYQGASILGSLYNYDFINAEVVKNATTLEDKTKAVITLFTDGTVQNLSTEKMVLALGGDPADNNAGLFYNGGMDLLKKVHEKDSNLNIPSQVDSFTEVANDKWDYAKGQTKLDTIIKAIGNDKSKIAAVLSPNDGMATSSINALKNNALDPTEIYITGQDSNDTAIVSISQGTGQDMTISKPDSKASAVAVAIAAQLVTDDSFNVAPGVTNRTDSNGYGQISSYIKSLFDDVEFTINGNQYEADKGKPINTILLEPQIVNSENVEDFFEITKNY